MSRTLQLLAIVGISLISTDALSAQLYKYKDTNGRMVFTDKKPPERIDFKSERLLYTESKKKIQVVNRGSRERPRLYAVNQYDGPVWIRLFFNRLHNMKFQSKGPYEWLVPANSDQQLLTFEPRNRKGPWEYRYGYDFVPGKPIYGEVANYGYGLPFRKGRFKITQAFFGGASHGGNKQNHYAIDVGMEEGTAIIASRSGTVMDAEGDFSRSGWHQSYMDEANVVRVRHDDGTMALYAHLAPDGIAVKKGDYVHKGDVLGSSGNTGFSSGPHLHFVIQKNAGRELVSIPFEFEDAKAVIKAGSLLIAQ